VPRSAEAPAPRVDGIFVFRALLGSWLIASAWLLGAGLDAIGVSNLVAGAAVIAVAARAERHPRLRFLQAAIAVWVMFSAVLIEPSGPAELYSDILTGKVILISAVVSRDLFT
jgi:hypothetical protein